MIPLNSDLMSGIDRAQQSVAKTAAEFQTLWQRHAPGRPVPTVDFTKNMVVAVFLGSRPSGGFAAEITGVTSEGDATIVRWTERKPGPGQMASQVMTAPAFMATVPRREGPVRFEKAEP
jgi:protease stability complex PrcB-like protein